MRAHQVELISNITRLHNGSFLPTLFTVETFWKLQFQSEVNLLHQIFSIKLECLLHIEKKFIYYKVA